MSQSTLHANLTSKVFPFSSRELSSTVLVNRGGEQNRTILPGFDGEEPVQSFGICQAYFMRNVLPLMRGYTSAHFTRKIAAQTVSAQDCLDAFVLKSASGESVLLTPANGDMAVFNPQLGTWNANSLDGIVHPNVTTTHLKGISYVAVAGLGLFTYNFESAELELQTITAIDPSKILGVCSAGSYLLLWTSDTVYYSSQITPLDFTPIPQAGGSTKILAVKGQITCLLPISGGFIAYTDKNAVSAVLSGNASFPFVFDEIAGSAGVEKPSHVSHDSNRDRHVAWTSSGFQFVTVKRAEPIWADLSDSLARNIMVVPNPEQADFPDLQDIEELDIKLNVIGARYICVSIGDSIDLANNFNFAYVYDATLDRWGRIDIPHTDIFEFASPDFQALLSWDDLLDLGTTWDQLLTTSWDDLLGGVRSRTGKYGTTFGVMNRQGTVFTLSMAKDAASANADSTVVTGAAVPQLVLGRYKIIRDNGVIHEWMLADEILEAAAVRIYAHDYNGNFNTYKDLSVKSQRTDNKWYGRQVGDAVSLGIFGKFNLTNLTVCMSDAGKRNILHNPPRYVPPTLDIAVVVGADPVLVGVDTVVVSP
jgi:hypothetical protein